MAIPEKMLGSRTPTAVTTDPKLLALNKLFSLERGPRTVNLPLDKIRLAASYAQGGNMSPMQSLIDQRPSQASVDSLAALVARPDTPKPRMGFNFDNFGPMAPGALNMDKANFQNGVTAFASDPMNARNTIVPGSQFPVGSDLYEQARTTSGALAGRVSVPTDQLLNLSLDQTADGKKRNYFSYDGGQIEDNPQNRDWADQTERYKDQMWLKDLASQTQLTDDEANKLGNVLAAQSISLPNYDVTDPDRKGAQNQARDDQAGKIRDYLQTQASDFALNRVIEPSAGTDGGMGTNTDRVAQLFDAILPQYAQQIQLTTDPGLQQAMIAEVQNVAMQLALQEQATAIKSQDNNPGSSRKLMDYGSFLKQQNQIDAGDAAGGPDPFAQSGG